ncbi:hypothetical protein swp_3453 [Shewanella piezotolerans WP3]|uniref:Uncharacterized protein n=1 Tax=Shewanella piezotolerans (strain WP3 / JCM 13877) TaxID=225849 RepID=B8CRZ4_SHEPW|nr:hypothetical protein swp_3453 [Shewanella piezotolerans WP3]
MDVVNVINAGAFNDLTSKVAKLSLSDQIFILIGISL